MSSFISFSQNFFETLSTLILPSIFKVLLIIAIAFFARYLIDLATNNFLQKLRQIRRVETIRQILASSSHVVVIGLAIIMILHELGLNITPIIASAGLLGVAFSLGAQNLMKDVINGFFILLEDQFTIGDKVKIGTHSGTVEKMNLRTTTLRDSDGSTHIILNSEINKVTVIIRSISPQ